MRYLIDTDWVASYLNGRQEATELFSRIEQEDLFISLITYGEIYDGIYYGRNPRQFERVFRELLKGVQIVPLNRAITQRFARVRGALRSGGQIIGDLDLLIAATALHHGPTLVTPNRRHFQRIPNLPLHGWPT
jgi:tRNA(fMet)-specific endonuclease VapC